jgi:hypothetical protein
MCCHTVSVENATRQRLARPVEAVAEQMGGRGPGAAPGASEQAASIDARTEQAGMRPHQVVIDTATMRVETR